MTAAIPTVTVIATGKFKLQAQGGPYNQQYAQITDSGNGFDDALVFTSSATAASVFIINNSGYLSDSTSSLFANANTGAPESFLYFDDASTIAIAQNGFSYVVCQVVSNVLQCNANGAMVFQIHAGQSNAGAGVALAPIVLSGDTGFSFNAMQVC